MKFYAIVSITDILNGMFCCSFQTMLKKVIKVFWPARDDLHITISPILEQSLSTDVINWLRQYKQSQSIVPSSVFECDFETIKEFFKNKHTGKQISLMFEHVVNEELSEDNLKIMVNNALNIISTELKTTTSKEHLETLREKLLNFNESCYVGILHMHDTSATFVYINVERKETIEYKSYVYKFQINSETK